nr:hypothetical protein [Caldilineaceae bacterium]
LTFLLSKNLNRSVQSELIYILPFDFSDVNSQFPRGIGPCRRGLGLPKRQIERAIQIFEFASAFNESSFVHGGIIAQMVGAQ